MADTPELPEAKDPFEKKVAISIAIIAVLLSYISMKGDNAKTDAIIKTNESANQWALYQAKSLKGHLAEMEADLLGSLPNAGDMSKKLEDLAGKVKKYDGEKEAIMTEAKKLHQEADEMGRMNDRCDLAALFLQIGIVIASVAILSRMHLFWYASLALSAAGVVKFFM